MQPVAHGVDIVRIERIERVWRDHGDHFLKRVFTQGEIDYCVPCKKPAARLAGRFAAKEAVLKALGTGWRGGIAWTDIEVLPDPLGRPLVTLHNHTAQLAARLGIRIFLLSISHDDQQAIASVIGLGTATEA
jgi:holo-[acyl-carrier protein] synthase